MANKAGVHRKAIGTLKYLDSNGSQKQNVKFSKEFAIDATITSQTVSQLNSHINNRKSQDENTQGATCIICHE